MQKITSIVNEFITFLNGTLVPLVFAIAFFLFLYGIFRYFILNADKPEERQKGTTFMMYGLLAFFIMLSVWGLVNLVTGSINLGSSARPCLPTFGNSSCGSSNSGTTNTTATSPMPADIPAYNPQEANDTVDPSQRDISPFNPIDTADPSNPYQP
jgi:hypothetical protein